MVGHEVRGALQGDLPVGPGRVVGQVAGKTNREYSQLGLLGMVLNLTKDVSLSANMSAPLSRPSKKIKFKPKTQEKNSIREAISSDQEKNSRKILNLNMFL